MRIKKLPDTMLQIIEVDFNDQEHCDAVVGLMNHYMEDKMGGAKPHDEESAKKLILGLRAHPNKLCLLARYNGEYIGLVNCFIGFGTFTAKPTINIHDIVVLNSHRGSGAGNRLLNEVYDRAVKMDCCKITLEVREDNVIAQNLYRKLGFGECEPTMHFWVKPVN